MKKILAIVLICAASTFAAWDYFPVIEYGKGEAKVSYVEWRQGNGEDGRSGSGLQDFKIRYSPMEKLELMSKYRGDKLGNYVLGARYQIMPDISAGLDFGFPIPSTAWSVTPNAQYSMTLTEALVFGSNVGVSIYTEDSNKNKRGADLNGGAELDLAMGKSTITFGLDINTGLTQARRNSRKRSLKSDNRGLEFVPKIGYVANAENLSLGTNIGLAFGEDAGHENYATFIGLEFAVKF
jgi:hypothetical protein